MSKTDIYFMFLNCMFLIVNIIWFDGYLSVVVIMFAIFAIVLLLIDIYIFRPTKKALQEYLDLLDELIENKKNDELPFTDLPKDYSNGEVEE